MPFAKLREIENGYRSICGPDRMIRRGGRIASLAPGICRVTGLGGLVRLGDMVTCQGHSGKERGEVISIDNNTVTLALYGPGNHIALGSPVFRDGLQNLLSEGIYAGRVVNAFGEPVDGKGPIMLGDEPGENYRPISSAGHAIARQMIGTPFKTGVRAIDVFTPLCFGQRIGIFAGSGVGKSTLLGMLARADSFDAVVVALVGERSREVREFIENSIGEAAMGKTAVVVATGDESVMVQRRAPALAMHIAERMRSSGKRVLLLLDSITRYANALRQVAMLLGEPPVARGYPASVFSDLAKLLERAGSGNASQGSITAIITVLVDGDDHNEPVSDSVRGILDGHLVLDRAVADSGRYPAINVLSSVSRLARKAWTPEQYSAVLRLRALMARFEETKDLRLLGAWKRGSDPDLDKAVDIVPALYDALCQLPDEKIAGDAFSEVAQRLRGVETAGTPANGSEAERP